jgi:hypothetical protein
MERYVRAVDVLESLLRRLLSTDWDERIRAQATSQAARLAVEAPRPARAISRGIVALLAVKDVDIRPELGQRLLELQAGLRDVDAA